MPAWSIGCRCSTAGSRRRAFARSTDIETTSLCQVRHRDDEPLPGAPTRLRALDLVPVAEFQLTSETIRRFRLGYVEAFGAPMPDDLLYHAVSEGRRHPGMEHWLPLFHDRLDTLFDYAPLGRGVGAARRGRRARAPGSGQGLLRGAT